MSHGPGVFHRREFCAASATAPAAAAALMDHAMNLTKLSPSVTGITALVVLIGAYLRVFPVRNSPVSEKHLGMPSDQSPRDAPPPGLSAVPPTLAREASPNCAGTAPRSARPVTQASNKLGIRPEDWKDAHDRASEMAANMDKRMVAGTNPEYYNLSLNTKELSQRLALRLRLDPEALKRVEGVLLQYREKQTAQLIETERGRMEWESRLLSTERDNYVNYLALETIVSRGDTLSMEQESFYQAFHGLMQPEATPGTPSDLDQWYGNLDLVNAMGQQLSAQQKSGLTIYIEEQKRRAAEAKTMQAYMRSGAIAEKLGLNEADRTTLYEYFQDHPDASRAELAGLIAPELSKLLPEGM